MTARWGATPGGPPTEGRDLRDGGPRLPGRPTGRVRGGDLSGVTHEQGSGVYYLQFTSTPTAAQREATVVSVHAGDEPGETRVASVCGAPAVRP
jgi:hypothetical protein